ncbi:MAG: pyrroline-5-carboxylate reductase [Dehalococcoidia bacterium]|nr:pyrroline-5-carboxylate reductase [Dehalococcoidia bacterium]
MRLAFIGGGVMAEAIIGGVLSKGVVEASHIAVGEPLEERRTVLLSRFGVLVFAENHAAVDGCDLVVLATKPQNLPDALGQLRGILQPDQVVLTIVAGTPMSTIIDGLNHAKVVRVMPNTPSQIGEGMTVWTSSPQVNEESKEMTASILETMGKQIYVSDEKYLDMATALSASGPAYVFMFIEALTDAGVHIGLSRDMSQAMALQTVLGSTKLAVETGKHPAELRNMVTSPGGTTVEALLELEDGGFRSSVLNAVIAAYRRSLELGGHRWTS